MTSKLERLKQAARHMLNAIGELYAFRECDRLLRRVKWPLYAVKGLKRPSIPALLHLWLSNFEDGLREVVRDASRLITSNWSVKYAQDWGLKGPPRLDLSIKAVSKLEPPFYIEPYRTIGVEYVALKRLIEFVYLTSSYVLERIERAKGLLSNPIYVAWIEAIEEKAMSLKTLCRKWLCGYPFSLMPLKPVGNIDMAVSELEFLLKRLKGCLRPWNPPWVKRFLKLVESAVQTWNVIRQLEDIVEHAIGDLKVRNAMRQAVRYLAWRLYELYVFLIVLKALKRICEGRFGKFDVKVERPIGCIAREGVIVSTDNAKIEICIGVALSHDLMSKAVIDPPILEARKLAGRPDIAIQGCSRRVVVEAKFTDSIAYLTASRFKLMAYVFEYNADTGILAFPWPPIRKGLEPEERATAELAYKAYEDGIIEVKLEKTRLCLVAIEPKEEAMEENVERMMRALEPVLKSCLG